MSSPVTRGVAPILSRHYGESLRVAYAGTTTWLDGCTPTQVLPGMTSKRLALVGSADVERMLAEIHEFKPHVTVIFDPQPLVVEALCDAPGATLGVLVPQVSDEALEPGLDKLDRLVSFDPSRTGTPVGRSEVWRAIPPPVSDTLFSDVRPLRHAPRSMSIGASSAHREEMLLPAKHHHDLLQVLHGVSGEPLRELLAESDVGVFVASAPGGGFGLQVGIHLAAGHLLLAEALAPAHGLERNIDYLHFDSANGLVWALERLRRFPSMYQSIRVRGRLKAEQYRASRVFRRIAGDLLADVAAFGSSRAPRS
jgi:hypothetical protein